MNKLIASNGQIITEIVNKQGRVLFKCDRCFQSLDELDLTEAELCGIVCEGLWCIGTNFTEADLRGADLYWAMALEANFSGADLSNADLRGAFLAAANFTGANLTNARLSRDNLGGSTDLRATVFKGAIITGADFTGATYNASTEFPASFSPDAFAMVWSHEPYSRIY